MATAVQSVQDVPKPDLDAYHQVAESKHERKSVNTLCQVQR